MSRDLDAALEYVAMNTTVPQWVISLITAPVDMILFCPHCNTQHIDAPDIPNNEPCPTCDGRNAGCPDCAERWNNPPHKTHLCRLDQGGCGWMWRPADVATNGVLHLASRHRLEMTAPHWELMAAKRYQETHINPPIVLRYRDYPYPNSAGELTKTQRLFPCCCTVINREKSALPERCPVHDARL